MSPADPGPAHSALLAPLFSGESLRGVFHDRQRLQRMLDFEVALARVEAALGVIPSAALPAIEAAAHADRFDRAALAQASARAGNIAIPLVQSLRAEVAKSDAEAAHYVHWGATSQDVIDTGLVLQLRAGFDVLQAQLQQLIAAFVALASRHRATLMAGRTWLQQAVPVTLGYKAAGWLGALLRDGERLQQVRERALCLQFGGAAGTLSALGDQGLQVAEALSAELELRLPDMPWHSQRDRIAETGACLGLLVGDLGKIARDVSLLMQSEVAEAFEPAAAGRGGSSTMPQKRNPVACAVALAAAVRAPGLVSTLLSAMVQEHERGLGGWHAEWETLPQLFELASGAAGAMLPVLSGLQTDAARMRANLELTHGQMFAERVALALAPRLGREAAHQLVEQACRQAQAQQRHLREILLEHTTLRGAITPAELEDLFRPEAALGVADTFIARALLHAREKGTAT